MADQGTVASFDATLHTLNPNDPSSPHGFSRKILIMAGDLRETFPRLQGGLKCQSDNYSIRATQFWKHHIQIRSLSLNVSESKDKEFTLFQDALADEARKGGMRMDAFPNMVLDSPKSGIDHLFPPEVLQNPTRCVYTSILTCDYGRVKSYNDAVLARLKGEGGQRYAADSSVNEDGSPSQVDIDASDLLDALLNFQPDRSFPPRTLAIKAGGCFQFILNFDIHRGLVKGTRVIVKHAGQKVISVVRVDGNGVEEGDQVLLSRIKFKKRWEQEEPMLKGTTLVRLQFPIAPVYAITVYRSQGYGLDRCVVEEPPR